MPRGCPEKSNALQCKKIPENWNWGWGGWGWGSGGVKARKDNGGGKSRKEIEFF